MRLAAVSVDLDEIPNYHAIHGLPAPAGRGAFGVYDVALPRFEAWASDVGIPLTLFAIGADMARRESAVALRAAAGRGHEIGNHTLEHLYDLTRRPRAEIERQVCSGRDVLAGATGERPRGFRAPGYAITDELVDVVTKSGAAYDSSVFPSPAYFAAKTAAIAAIRVRGRKSRSIVDDPRVLGAPTEPYRMGAPYWRRGGGLLEIPVQVTRGARLPYIGTSLTLAGESIGDALTRMVIGAPVVNLELHGIDLLDEHDDLAALRAHQPDVRVPVAAKLARLTRAIELLRGAGYAFVRLDEIARQLQK